MSTTTVNPTTITTPSDVEIEITRTFDAPRDLVFEVWTKAEHVAKWWAPECVTMLDCQIDLRVGGAFRYFVEAPDGSQFAFKGEYREIVPPERLVHTQILDVPPYADSVAVVTVLFSERDGRTTIKETIRHPSMEARDGHLNSGMREGAVAALDQLEALLAALRSERAATTARGEVRLVRTYDAPRDLVWQVWTDPRHVAQWWGPECFTNPRCEWDARPGGAIHIDMQAPDGTVYPMAGDFGEVVAPERLIFVASALDSDGSRQIEAVTTVTLTETAGKTKVELYAAAVGFTEAAPAMLAGMEEGWAQSFVKFADRLASI
jgi:uncharacterized protein YndB with AHSA1/START domain